MHREQRSSSLPVLRLRMRKVVEGFFFIFVQRAERSPAFPSWKLVRFSRQIHSVLSAAAEPPHSHLAAGAISGRCIRGERGDAALAALCSARPGSALAVFPKEHQGAASFPCSPPLLADSNASLPDSALCRISHSFCGSAVQLLVWQRQPRSCPASLRARRPPAPAPRAANQMSSCSA